MLLASSIACTPQVPKLRVGTYNLRMAHLDANSPDNNWQKRQPRLIESFLREDMDLCAVQEVGAEEQESIPRLLAERGLAYESYFFSPYARDGAGGRAHGLLWKKDRFRAGDPHFFWLSDPPDSLQENDHCGRINYIRGGFCITLTDLAREGAHYFVMVTHAHLNKEDHARGARIFVEMEKRYNPEGLPSFFLGDMNAHEEDSCSATYRSYWMDAYHCFDSEPSLREGPVGTYNGWNPESVSAKERRIDFVYFRGEGLRPLRYVCDNTLFEGLCASDHFPVYVDFE